MQGACKRNAQKYSCIRIRTNFFQQLIHRIALSLYPGRKSGRLLFRVMSRLQLSFRYEPDGCNKAERVLEDETIGFVAGVEVL